MNSAKRIVDILKAIQEQKTYFDACKKLFSCDELYQQLYFYKYFLNDLKSIERVLKSTGKYKEDIHKKNLGLTAFCISPNYLEKEPSSSNIINQHNKRINDINLAIEFMELMETFIPDETLYDKDIEALRIALKDVEKTNSPLDDIISDIDEAVLYYGYFGNNIIEDKFHRVIGNTVAYMDKIKPVIKKFPKVVKILIDFFEFYKKIKEIKEELPTLVEMIKKELDIKSDSIIDADILDVEETV